MRGNELKEGSKISVPRKGIYKEASVSSLHQARAPGGKIEAAMSALFYDVEAFMQMRDDNKNMVAMTDKRAGVARAWLCADNARLIKLSISCGTLKRVAFLAFASSWRQQLMTLFVAVYVFFTRGIKESVSGGRREK